MEKKTIKNSYCMSGWSFPTSDEPCLTRQEVMHLFDDVINKWKNKITP